MKIASLFTGKRSRFSGAAFLMATSAIGPGFITQTTVFTQQLFTSFGFVILLSVFIDLLVQLNIWRIVAVSAMEAPAIADKVARGSGLLLVILVSGGGLIFNIGNIGGCGLALQTLFGLPVKTGAIISCLVAVLIFLNAEFGSTMDMVTKTLGFVMIGLVLFTAIKTNPPLPEILKHTIFPSAFNITSVVTIVGGTVGGYISFAGAHRMLDASRGSIVNIREVNTNAARGILLASLMRFLLFIAAAGVIAKGIMLPAANPAAGVFEASAGLVGLKLFGIVLWAAAITSVVGAAYTSISFIQTIHPFIAANRRWFIIGFILLSTIVFATNGNPVMILVKAGAVNGIILPLSLTLMLLASRKKKIVSDYSHPIWLTMGGWLVVILLSVLSIRMLLF